MFPSWFDQVSAGIMFHISVHSPQCESRAGLGKYTLVSYWRLVEWIYWYLVDWMEFLSLPLHMCCKGSQGSLTLSVKEAIKNIWYYWDRRYGLELKAPLVELTHTRALWHLCDIYMKIFSQTNNCRLEREQFWTKSNPILFQE